MPPFPQKPYNNDFLKFSGMAIQMAVTIGAFVFIGRKIDGPDGVMYTLLGSLLGVGAAFYSMIKALNQR